VADDRRTAGGLLGLHAQTPLHPGAGTALGTVDLPIQRERHTHWPNAAGSSLKGILRDACRDSVARMAELHGLVRHDDERDEQGAVARRAERKGTPRDLADNTLLLNELFGPPTAGSGEFAGSLSVTDARLLALPVRSLRGVFAWVTCKGVLDRFGRDAALAGVPLAGWPDAVPDVPKFKAAVPADCPCLLQKPAGVVLEEFQFDQTPGDPVPFARAVAAAVLPGTPAYKGTRDRFAQALVLLNDDDFTYFARYATEIMARIKLNYETKTVEGGALFYQEFLPAETLLYAVVLVNPARGRFAGAPAADLLKRFAGWVPEVLQVGGEESVGKGFCGVRLFTNGGGK
jgi:CRISPR-associated protein Cmr4